MSPVTKPKLKVSRVEAYRAITYRFYESCLAGSEIVGFTIKRS